MTLAIGVSCPEGAVIVTDGITRYIHGDNVTISMHEGRTLGIESGSGFAYVLSGTFTPDADMRPVAWADVDPPAEETVCARARRFFRAIPAGPELSSSYYVGLLGRELNAEEWASRRHTHEMIVAPLDLGRYPTIGFLSCDTERWLGPLGGVVLAGASRRMRDFYYPQITDEALANYRFRTLASCRDWAIGFGKQFMAVVNDTHPTLEAHVAAGSNPSGGWPLWGRTITPTETHVWRHDRGQLHGGATPTQLHA